MNRLKITLRNFVIIIVLFLLFLNRSGLYLDPMTAHESSERSIHYGPSKVVHIEEFKNEIYLLGKFDKWVSCNTVKRSLFFFWTFGSGATGFENDLSKDIAYSWSGSYNLFKLYGIVNNNDLDKVEFTLENGDVLSTTTFYEDLFLFTFEVPNDSGIYIKNIKGYDKDNSLIYEVKQ